MLSLTTIIGLLLAGCTLAATAFYLLSMIAAYRFFSLTPDRKNTEAQRHRDTEEFSVPPCLCVSVFVSHPFL